MSIKNRATRIVGVGVCCIAVFAGCGDKEVTLDEAGNLFVAAQEAITAGDRPKAIQLLSASIEEKPSAWAYLERAKLHLEEGDEAAAKSDCQAGLQLEPENADLKWLLGELEKPESRRFKGRFKNPPSVSK